MLPEGTLPSLAVLLTDFRSCFTAPGHRTFTGLVVGLIAQTRRRTVCGMLLGAGLERLWHHSRAHRFLSAARWCADTVGLALADVVLAYLLPADTPITVVVDDTLFKRSGKKVFGAAWHHDGAAKGPRCRRAPVTLPLVHHQDRAALRRHDDQAASRPHRRQISALTPRPGHPRRNPSRPRSLGRRRNMINQNRETRGSL
jgi:hypothetical protein